MSGPMPPQGGPSPQQIAQMRQQFIQEAQRLGITPEELQARQRQHLTTEAAKQGLTVEQYVLKLRERQIRQVQAQQQAQQQGQAPPGQQPPPQGPPPQGQQQLQQIPVNPGAEAKPEALAVAKFLRSQDLKTRVVVLDGQRRDMFKVKRATRALFSPAYLKARSKNPLLPEVTDDAGARRAIQLLPLSMLALRVSKADPHEGHDHAKPKKDAKRVKGQWTVKVERQQDFEPMMHYVWLYEGPQWKKKVYAGLALIAVMTVVLFPLWPLFMRQGVWYLSVGAMGLLGAFFAMAIFRLILFCVTLFVVPPGLWLFPNLFEDVGFFDSFKPLWGWHPENKKKKKAKKSAGGAVEAPSATEPSSTSAANGSASGSAAAPPSEVATVTKRHMAPQVEEVEDE